MRSSSGEMHSEDSEYDSWDTSSESDESSDQSHDREWHTRPPDDSEIVCLHAHTELIRRYPLIEIKSPLIDLLFDEFWRFGVFFWDDFRGGKSASEHKID